MKILWVSACVVLLFAAASVSAQTTALPAGDASGSDWPQWAGPKGDCTSDEKGLLKEWPKEGPKVLWRIPVGVGSNHPSVAGDDLCYAQLDDDQLHETIKCIDANSGKEKWSYTYKVYPTWWVGWGELGVRATPTITDTYVYTMGTFGQGFCFDRKTGTIVWQHRFSDENSYLAGLSSGSNKYGNLEWKGFTGGLRPTGDKISYFVFQGGNPKSPGLEKNHSSGVMEFYAYDAKTGKVAWKFEEDSRPGSLGGGLVACGALPIKFNNEDCFLAHGNRDWKMLRQSDGKQVWNWECTGPKQATPGFSASGGPRPVGKNLYIDQLDGWQFSLIECDFSAKDPKPKVLWTTNEIHGAVTPFVVVNDCIYGFIADKASEADGLGDHPAECHFSLRCSDLKTGKLLWKQPGFKMGLSMVSADGMLYLHDFQRLILAEANSTGYVEKGRIEKLHDIASTPSSIANHKGLLDWNMPVISEGRLFIRTPVELICYDIKDRKAR